VSPRSLAKTIFLSKNAAVVGIAISILKLREENTPRGARWALGLGIDVKPTVGGAQGLSTLAAGHNYVLSNVVSIA
jgi:hypothetical protein